MNAVFEDIATFITSAFSFVATLLKGIFVVKDSVDTVKDQITAAIFGVPVWVVVLIGSIVTIGGIIFAVARWIYRRM